MDKINFQDLPSTTTPVDATNMNLLQTNVENGIADAGVVVSVTEPTGSAKKKIWKQHSRNKLNFKSFERAYIDINGEKQSVNTNALFNNILVKSSTSYTFSASSSVYALIIVEYAQDLSMIRRTTQRDVSSYTITTQSNTYYISYGFNYDNSSTITQSIINTLKPMVNEGSSALTYESHIDDREYQLDNNTYNELSIENKIYSLDEKRIGRWINGKPIYRRTFKGVFSTETTDDVRGTINISPYWYISTIIKWEGFIDYVNPAPILSSIGASTWLKSTNKLNVYSREKAYLNANFYLTIEYTKSQD